MQVTFNMKKFKEALEHVSDNITPTEYLYLHLLSPLLRGDAFLLGELNFGRFNSKDMLRFWQTYNTGAAMNALERLATASERAKVRSPICFI